MFDRGFVAYILQCICMVCFMFDRVPGSQWALEMAKYNLVHNYLVVGLTEDIGGMVAVLEATLPRFFAGATELYNKGN